MLIISRNNEKLNVARKKLSVYTNKVQALAFDLSDLSKTSNLIKEINLVFDGIDVLVNNAAMGLFKRIEDIKPSELDQIIKLNVQSPYILTQQLLLLLQKSKGNIINMSSYFSHKMISGRNSNAYSIIKGAMDSFTKSLASELGLKDIRVNAIAPGSVKTPLFNTAINKMNSEEREAFMSRIKVLYPLERIGEPDDLGGIADFLASEQAKWITGAIMNVDGGLTIN